ncbi:MAG: FMN-binding protein, partial [Pirellulaceae bacterium]
SRDTPEHVEAIEKHSPFFQQFVGQPAAPLANAQLDSVSGATLTSMAIVESVITRLGGDPPNYRFPEEIDLEEAVKFFEAAHEIIPSETSRGLVEVRGPDGERLGQLFRTSPHADHIVGYQGPTDALVALNDNDEVIGIRLRHSYDNQPYVRYVNEDYIFPEVLNETTWDQLVELDLESSGIEGISGATMTSQAMIEAIFVAARKIELARSAPPRVATGPHLSFKLRDLGTILVVLFAVVVAFTSLRSNRWVRLGFPLVLIFYLGFYNGDVLSQALWVGWAQYGIPWHRTLGLAVLAAAAFAVPLVSKKQLYCNHVCPHGQAQILIARYSPWQWKMPKWLRSALRPLPAILLLLVVLTAMGQASVNLSSIEPFNAYIPSIAGWMAISIAIGGLIFSAFVPMGYCKYGCPTGAVLTHLRYQAKSDRWTHRDTIATL